VTTNVSRNSDGTLNIAANICSQPPPPARHHRVRPHAHAVKHPEYQHRADQAARAEINAALPQGRRAGGVTTEEAIKVQEPVLDWDYLDPIRHTCDNSVEWEFAPETRPGGENPPPPS